MLYGATRQAHPGCGIAARRASHRATAKMLKTAAIKRSCPSLDADVEEKKSERDGVLRQADFA